MLANSHRHKLAAMCLCASKEQFESHSWLRFARKDCWSLKGNRTPDTQANNLDLHFPEGGLVGGGLSFRPAMLQFRIPPEKNTQTLPKQWLSSVYHIHMGIEIDILSQGSDVILDYLFEYFMHHIRETYSNKCG